MLINDGIKTSDESSAIDPHAVCYNMQERFLVRRYMNNLNVTRFFFQEKVQIMEMRRNAVYVIMSGVCNGVNTFNINVNGNVIEI